MLLNALGIGMKMRDVPQNDVELESSHWASPDQLAVWQHKSKEAGRVFAFDGFFCTPRRNQEPFVDSRPSCWTMTSSRQRRWCRFTLGVMCPGL